MQDVNFITKWKEKATLDNIYILNIYFFPLFFLSSFLMNLSLIGISFYSIYFIFKKKIYYEFKNKILLTVISFWIYLIFISIFIHGGEKEILKSISYVRFIFLFFSLVFIFPKLNFNISKILLFYFLIALIFSLDIIFQYIFGFNTFGFKCGMVDPSGNCLRLSGFFDEELVAGSFILIFGTISLIYFLKEKKNLNFFIFFLIFFSIVIFLTGDRNPFLSIIFIFIANILLNNQIRIKVAKIFFIFIFFVTLFIFLSDSLRTRYVSNTYHIFTTSELSEETFNWSINHTRNQINFLEERGLKKKVQYQEWKKKTSGITLNNLLKKNFEVLGINYYITQTEELLYLIDEKDFVKKYQNPLLLDKLKTKLKIETKRRENVLRVKLIRKNNNTSNKWYNFFLDSQYGAHYLMALSIFNENPLFGKGIKSFRDVCRDHQNINSLSAISGCSTHPHNSHLEILSETGLLGYSIFLILILNCLIILFKKKYFNKGYLVFIIFILISYIFPLKPSGSFFSTFNSFNFWLCISLIQQFKNFENEKKD